MEKKEEAITPTFKHSIQDSQQQNEGALEH